MGTHLQGFFFTKYGVFLLFANVIFLGEEQVFRVIKQRKLERLSERYPSLMCVRKVGSKWYYRYLLLLVVVGDSTSLYFMLLPLSSTKALNQSLLRI